MGHEVNGQAWFKVLEEKQDEKFSSLEGILTHGFDQIAQELRMLREQGHIPVSVVAKVIDILKPIIRTLCITLVVLIAWFTGIKYYIPHIFPQ